MNELQAKLARRRNLNGENVDISSSISTTSSVHLPVQHEDSEAGAVSPPSTTPPRSDHRKSLPITAAGGRGLGARTASEELQRKLARRRCLNGETATDPATATNTPNTATTSATINDTIITNATITTIPATTSSEPSSHAELGTFEEQDEECGVSERDEAGVTTLPHTVSPPLPILVSQQSDDEGEGKEDHQTEENEQVTIEEEENEGLEHHHQQQQQQDYLPLDELVVQDQQEEEEQETIVHVILADEEAVVVEKAEDEGEHDEIALPEVVVSISATSEVVVLEEESEVEEEEVMPTSQPAEELLEEGKQSEEQQQHEEKEEEEKECLREVEVDGEKQQEEDEKEKEKEKEKEEISQSLIDSTSLVVVEEERLEDEKKPEEEKQQQEEKQVEEKLEEEVSASLLAALAYREAVRRERESPNDCEESQPTSSSLKSLPPHLIPGPLTPAPAPAPPGTSSRSPSTSTSSSLSSPSSLARSLSLPAPQGTSPKSPSRGKRFAQLTRSRSNPPFTATPTNTNTSSPGSNGIQSPGTVGGGGGGGKGSRSNLWYPGKFIYERRLPWTLSSPSSNGQGGVGGGSSSGNTRQLSMDNEAARTHYQDFINTPPTLTSTLFGRSLSSNSVGSPHTNTPPPPPAAMVSYEQLVEENLILRKEVMRLRSEIERQQRVIEAYELSTKTSDDFTEGSGSNGVGTGANVRNSLRVRPSALTDMGLVTVTEGDYEGGDYDESEEEEDDEEGGLFDDLDLDDGHTPSRLSTLRSSIRDLDLLADVLTSPPNRLPSMDVDEGQAHLVSLLPSRGVGGGSQARGGEGAAGHEGAGPGRKIYNPLTVGSERDLLRSFPVVQGNTSTSAAALVTSRVADLIEEATAARSSAATPLFRDATTTTPTTPIASTSPLTADAGDSAALNGDTQRNSTTIAPSPSHDITKEGMTYEEFLLKFGSSMDLVDATRRFLLSVLGPKGDCEPPPKNRKVDYIFYGLHRLDERCRQFFDEMLSKFVSHPNFQGECEERLQSARDQLENYVMTRLGARAFELCRSEEEDNLLLKRMKLLSFLTPEALEIKADLLNEPLLSLAGDELRKINAFKSPGEKVQCIVKCVTIIFRSLSLARIKQDHDDQHEKDGDEEKRSHQHTPAGADDFLPLLIWVVLHCHIPYLFSNCEYIQSYMNPARLMSKAGYCLINLRSAIDFVCYLDSSTLNMDRQAFEEAYRQAEEQFHVNDTTTNDHKNSNASKSSNKNSSNVKDGVVDNSHDITQQPVTGSTGISSG
eukprot:gene4153-4562_t